MHPTVSVTIPYLSDPVALERCLGSLARSTVRPVEVLLVDNGSSTELSRLIPKGLDVKVLRNNGNVGFARAVNQGFKHARGEFLLVLNADAFVDTDYIEILLEAMADTSVAGLTGKLLKESDATILDSTGHLIWGDRRVTDRGEWETDGGQYDDPADVFSLPATAALFRMEALLQVAAVTSELFDESFFSYGEDVDLAWRLRLMGWSLGYVPGARALHRRAISGSHRPTRKLAWDLRNRHLYMVKNDSWRSVRRHAGEILLLELRLLAYFVTHRPAVLLLALIGFFSRLPRALRKRRAIKQAQTAGSEAIEKWFGRYDYGATFRRTSA